MFIVNYKRDFKETTNLSLIDFQGILKLLPILNHCNCPGSYPEEKFSLCLEKVQPCVL